MGRLVLLAGHPMNTTHTDLVLSHFFLYFQQLLFFLERSNASKRCCCAENWPGQVSKFRTAWTRLAKKLGLEGFALEDGDHSGSKERRRDHLVERADAHSAVDGVDLVELTGDIPLFFKQDLFDDTV